MCMERLLFTKSSLSPFPLLPHIVHIISESPWASISISVFVSLPPRLSSLPQVTTSAGCFHWNKYLERLDFKGVGHVRSRCNVSLGVGAGRECEIGAREYKYVAGNTSEYGGEDESERDISPTSKWSTEPGFLQLSYCSSEFIKKQNQFNLRDEKERENRWKKKKKKVEGKRMEVKEGNLPWLRLTHG